MRLPMRLHRTADELQRLRSLAALEKTVRERGLHSVSLVELVGELGLSQTGFDELFATGADYLHATFDQALVLASARVAADYRAKTRGSWRDRVRAGMRGLFEAYDDDLPSSAAFLVAIPQAGPEIHLDLWELPPARPASPHRHRLGREELILVLDGRPTLCTSQGHRHLHRDQAAVIGHEESALELLNSGRARVRFLALSSSGPAMAV